MLDKERQEWRKAVHDVTRAERRKRQRNKKHIAEMNKRIDAINHPKFYRAGKQKREEMKAAAYSKTLSCFGLKQQQDKPKKNYFEGI